MPLLDVSVVRRIAQARADATGQRYVIYRASNHQPRFLPIDESLNEFRGAIEIVEPAHV